MEVKQDSISIVIVGRWNPYILSPQWISKHLFDGEPQVQIEFSLNLDLPNRFKIQNVLIVPTPEKVVITSANNSDESFSLMETAAMRLCDILSHTPVNAFGINFSYIEKEETDEILSHFQFEKDEPFSENNWEIKSHVIKRTLVKDEFQLNLSLTLNEESEITFDFNYTYPLMHPFIGDASLQQYISNILKDNGINRHYTNSKDLLDHIYHLNLQEND